MKTIKKLGTVITTPEGPSVNGFSFVISSGEVKRGAFISVQTDEGTIIASVMNIFKTNRYFESAGAVNEYNKTSELYHAFPIKEWEYTIAEAKPLGVYTQDGMLNRSNFPPSPGSSVTEVESQMLNKFLGLDQEKGVNLGTIQQHDLDAKFNLTRLLQKHMAILAISGAGKSYATAVLLEELLSRDAKQGKIAVLVVDPHGEYVSLKEDLTFKDKITVIDAKDVRISVRNMSGKSFASLIPNMSPVQSRELGRIIALLKQSADSFSLKEVISAIRESEEISKATAEALIGWLAELEYYNIFSTSDWPNVDSLLLQGHLVILNFRDILDLKKKQLIVNYISRKLFKLRREGNAPPYLEIIEEAHNFCPEGQKAEYALSRGIIETLAREGRKFYANLCLISQRPIQLSTTALSQCNTQIILKITNPYDLDHIGKSSEAISKSTLDIVSSLKVGEALVIGEACNYPVFIKIRQRKSKESHGRRLEDYAILYEKKTASSKLAKAEEFL